MLESGRKIPAIAGSDYHRDELGLGLGVPSTIVYAQSSSPSDILSALHAGKSYFVYQQSARRNALWRCRHRRLPSLGTGMNRDKDDKVKAGDRVNSSVPILLMNTHSLRLMAILRPFTPKKPGFVRLELWQSLYGLLPPMPVLVSNPIWID